MKVKQFLNRFLYGSSSIRSIAVICGTGKTQLVGVAYDPMAKDTEYKKQLNARLVSFCITGDELTIYAE